MSTSCPIALPHAERRDVDLVRKGDDLVLTVGGAPPGARPAQRVATLRHRRRGVRDGRLRVRFRADPTSG